MSLRKFFLRLAEGILYLSLFGSVAIHGALRQTGPPKGEERLFLFGISIISVLLLLALYYNYAKYPDNFFFYRIGNLFRKVDEAASRYKSFWIALRRVLVLSIIVLVVGLTTGFVYYVLFPSTTQNEDLGQKIEVNGYSMVLPREWDATGLSDNSYTLASNGADIGSIGCPMPETGFEAWNFEKQARLFQIDGLLYGVDLWIGNATSDDNEDISLIFMHRGAFDEWYQDENYQHSCYAQLTADVSRQQLEELYQTITRRN